MRTWIERKAREKARNIIYLSLLAIGITGFMLYLNVDYWRVFFHGPPLGDTDALNRDAAAATAYETLPYPYLTIQGEATADTGAYLTKSEVLETTTTRYYVLKIQEKVLIVEDAGKNTPGTVVTGSLGAASQELKNTLFPEGTDPALVDRVYPLVLSTDYKGDGWAALFWIAIVNVPLLIFAYIHTSRLLGWKEFRLVTKVKKWGDLSQVSAEVENQYTFQSILRARRWVITPDYVVRNAMFLFDIHRTDDLLWAYKQVTKKRVNLIPIGKDYDVRLEFLDGSVKLSGKEKDVDRAVELLSESRPWIFSGYHDGLDQVVVKSRQALIDEVNERKARMRNQR